MARSFGERKNGDGKKDDEHTSDDSECGAASNGSCVDEGDSTQNTEIEQYSEEEISEDAAEGRHLYLDFVRTEIVRNGMGGELSCLDQSLTVSTDERPVDGITDAQRQLDWTRAGQELRQLADAFSRSKERLTVRKRAQDVSLESLDSANFINLLQELFQVQWLYYWLILFALIGGGITRERILVLFFFCADVAIEALRRGFHRTFHELLTWSLRYIATNVAQYVHAMGGWGAVLRQSLDIAYQVSACCAFVAVVVACVVYIKRNLN